MPVAAPISVEEYLKTSYHPDCDYVDGEVLERNLGERDHGRVQREIVFLFLTRYPALRDRVCIEQRVQVKASSFRIPDICVLAEDAPEEQIVRTPPDLCVEILSPEDTLGKLMARIKDYLAMGVPVCWVIDPQGRAAWVARPGHFDEVADGLLRAEGIELPLADVLKFPKE